MRRLARAEISTVTVLDAIEGFNARARDLGLKREEDLVSVSVMPTQSTVPYSDGQMPTVDVVFIFWEDDDD